MTDIKDKDYLAAKATLEALRDESLATLAIGTAVDAASTERTIQAIQLITGGKILVPPQLRPELLGCEAQVARTYLLSLLVFQKSAAKTFADEVIRREALKPKRTPKPTEH